MISRLIAKWYLVFTNGCMHGRKRIVPNGWCIHMGAFYSHWMHSMTYVKKISFFKVIDYLPNDGKEDRITAPILRCLWIEQGQYCHSLSCVSAFIYVKHFIEYIPVFHTNFLLSQSVSWIFGRGIIWFYERKKQYVIIFLHRMEVL